MTQEGYKWLHEQELVAEANPWSMLYQTAFYARAHGADGIQHLILLDEKPQTQGEKIGKQVNTALRFSEQIRCGQSPTAISEGTRTKYTVRGEMVRFMD